MDSDIQVTQENKEFRILTAIGMITVVLGHLNSNVLDVFGLFPYYSYHVFIFVFVAGYFYKPKVQENLLSYIGHKFLKLMVPYYIWNLLYGILTMILHNVGFTIGYNLSFRTMFLDPFLGGHHFMYHFPSWFVPALFVIEVVNVLGRKVLSVFRLDKEWLIFCSCLFMGIMTVYLAIGGHVWGYYKDVGRILFLMPGFQLGRIYKEKIEKYNHFNIYLYLFVIIMIQLIIRFTQGGLNFSAVWVTSFANGPLVPFLTVTTGIAFWIGISKILNKIPYVNKLMVTIGRNSFRIMMHHMSMFLLLKTIFLGIKAWQFQRGIEIFKDFDMNEYLQNVSYVYLPDGKPLWIIPYIVIGIGVPVFMGEVMKRIYQRK